MRVRNGSLQGSLKHRHVSGACGAEAAPGRNGDRMRLVSDRIRRIGGLTNRPPHPHLPAAAFSSERLHVCEHNLAPSLFSPATIAMREGEALSLVLIRQLEDVTCNSPREACINQSAVDCIDTGIHAELATDAAGCGELCLLRLSDDRCILLCSRLSLAAAAMRIVRIFLRQPVAHSVLVAKDARSNGSDFVALLSQNADGDSLLLAQMAVRVLVAIEQRWWRRRRGRRSGCCSYIRCVFSFCLLLLAAWPAFCMTVQLGSRQPALAADALLLLSRSHPPSKAQKHHSA